MATWTFKELVPLIGTLITVICGYRLISVQINKNRRAKWIDDFRREIASFFAIATDTNRDFTIEKGYQLLSSTSLLILYLFDTNEKKRRELVDKLKEFQIYAINKGTVFGKEEVELFADKLVKIMTLASEVILIEQRKI